MRTLEQITAEIVAVDNKVEQLENQIETLGEERHKLMSEGFKLKYGYAFGEEFLFNGKSYILVDQDHVKLKSAKNPRRASGIRDFFLGESDSPYLRKPLKLDGPLKY